jgi:type IV secretion system protein VirB6
MIYAIIETISVYLMSIMFIAILIILAPIFLVFILFDRTRYLFDNWVSYLVRYCLEPVLLLGGIIILFQLYSVYIDQILDHSVCWKCAWPFKIPILTAIPELAFFSPTLTLFCINWFVPWGYEYGDPSMSISFYDIIVVLILSRCMVFYVGFISQASETLFSGRGSGSGGLLQDAAKPMKTGINYAIKSLTEKY